MINAESLEPKLTVLADQAHPDGITAFVQEQTAGWGISEKKSRTPDSNFADQLVFSNPFPKHERLVLARSDDGTTAPGLHDAGKYEYRITPEMVAIKSNIVDAFNSAQAHGKTSIVNLDRAYRQSLPLEGSRYLQLSVPPMSDFSWRHYELARLTNDPRSNLEHRNYEKVLMETLQAHQGPISQEYLTKAALMVSTDRNGSCDKELALLLLNNFTKNLSAVVRRESKWGYEVSEERGKSFPSDTYSNEQVDAVWSRLQGLGDSNNSDFQRAGQLYHLYGGMFAESIGLGVGVYVERVMRTGDGAPHDPVENGAGVLGKSITQEIKMPKLTPTPNPQPGPPSIW